MSFVEEYPVSQALLDRFDWTSLPLLYQGEAGMYCNVPHFVLIDYANDLVYYTGGGGIGRTTRIVIPDTEVLYFKGVPIRFIKKITDKKSYKNETTGLYMYPWKEYSITKIIAASSLLKDEKKIIKAIILALTAIKDSKFMTNAKDISIKITTKVEYI